MSSLKPGLYSPQLSPGISLVFYSKLLADAMKLHGIISLAGCGLGA